MPDGSNDTVLKPSPQQASGTPAPIAPPARPRRRGLRLVLLAGVPLVVAAVGLVLYAMGGRYAGTDNAYVHADTVSVAPEISGRLVSIDVATNQPVKAGQVLFHIDDRAPRYALERAEAAMRSATYDYQGIKASLGQARSLMQVSAAGAAYEKRELDRTSALAKSDNASQSALDQASILFTAASIFVQVAQSQIDVTLAKLGGDETLPLEKYPPYAQAVADRDQAQLDLDHTQVKAPFDGIAAKADAVLPGAMVAAGTPVLAVVRSDKLWIDANLNETDLTNVKVGQPVAVTVDTYPGVTWAGRVASLSPASGAEFSLLPPQNSSGNWVKVTQRIPVRVLVDTAGKPQLRAGMSAEVAIDTGHARGLPFLGGTAFGAQ
ncbi:HlyD family secretion protein [Mycobacterium sp. KBS0706]|uniref:HlyD family secretion protein n=1 Tax=Mycobacterium sp. KBS0706 TaxID=2578109 RepID=UPI00110F7849|nr:HlyD family secretion protein [Mycobacterium sp. KBS0706]TSD88311.1 HlyD family secretion protein [Mycobacterium sp. KBS0706]